MLRYSRLAVRLAYPGDQWRTVGDTTAGTALGGQAEAFAWLEAERSNLLAISRQAVAASETAAPLVGPP
jgi:hypothetical protein